MKLSETFVHYWLAPFVMGLAIILLIALVLLAIEESHHQTPSNTDLQATIQALQTLVPR